MAKVGFLGPKRFFSTAPTDFLRLAPEGTDVAGAFIPAAGFGATMAALSLDAIAAAVPGMKEAAQDFAQAGADVVAQFGAPFRWRAGPARAAFRRASPRRRECPSRSWALP